MRTVGIAELKTHLSRYLAKVRQGERFLVLDRSEPIAQLVPQESCPGPDPLDRLIHAGLATAAGRAISDVVISEVEAPFSLSEDLHATRGDTV